MSELFRRFLFLFRKRQFDRDLEAEMRFHMAMIGGDAGARRRFGNPTLLREASRDAWGWSSWERLWQDLRYAARILLRSPGFTLVAVLALAIGIGANTAIFSVVNAVLLRPLPYRDSDRLVFVWQWNVKQQHINTVTGADYTDWKTRSRIFEDIGYSWDEAYTITGTGNPESVVGYMLSTNFLPMLGARPLFGRVFSSEEGQPGRDQVVILSYRLWQRRFASNRSVIGSTIKLNDKDYTIIGVMPPGFAHPSALTQLWTPLAVSPSFFNDRKIHALRVVARLQRGVDLQHAQAEMDLLAQQLAREHPDTNAGSGIRIWPISQAYTGDIRTSLLVLQGAVLLMLLIACANVGNLLLARASARGREVAIRLALGAGQSRLLRQFLTEALFLSLLGAAAGLAIAFWGVQALTALLPPDVALFAGAEHSSAWIDWKVLLFTLAVALASGLVFGSAPMLRAHRSPGEALKTGAATITENLGRARIRKCLVISQLALSLMLLIGAGLMIRSLLVLQARQLGFRTDHVLTFGMFLPETRYGGPQRTSTFLAEVLNRIQALPGVQSAGATNALPLTGMSAHRNFTIPGQPALSYSQQANAEFRLATPGYFRAIGIRLLRGRYFDEGDRIGAANVALINETMARRFFPDQDPIGKSISVADAGTPAVRQIVGVVADTRPHGLASIVDPEIYRPFYQAYWPFAGVAIHSSLNPESLTSAVSRAVWAVDKDQPVNSVMTMEQLLSRSMAPQRSNTLLLAVFGTIALLLATLGIYGVMAYSVTQRTRDIGIRMALGARRHSMLAMILRETFTLAAIGVCIGLGAAFAATRLMKSLLYGVTATDPITFATVALLLGTVAVLSAYIPARRASNVDPMLALRYE